MKLRHAWLLLVVISACQTDTGEKPALTREQLLNPESCKDCHPKHYREWSGSMHAYAAKDPVFRAMNARGQHETNGQLGEFCVKCHAPMAVREGAIHDLTKLDDIPEPLQGVTCYFCHNATSVGSEHMNANITLANDTTMRAALDKPLEPTAHRVQYSANHDPTKLTSSVLCGTCHDIKTPAGVRLERTFEEYASSLVGQADKRSSFASCQDCHMGGGKRTQPIADSTGRPGEVVRARTAHEHLWAAVDVPMTDFPHAQALRAAVESCELQRSMSYFTVEPGSGPGSPFTVYLETNAGHAQPSRAAQDRRKWVEVIAFDANDKVVYSSGVVADGAVEETADKPHPCMFRDRLKDASGNDVHMFWDAASYKSRLLPPAPINGTLMPGGHSATCDYRPLLPQAPARIELKVRIRPMGMDVLQDLVESGYLAADLLAQMPTFSVASYEARYNETKHTYELSDTGVGDCTSYRCMLDPSDTACQ
jgi:hypothetical protein